MNSIGTAVTSSYRDHWVQSGVVETIPILSIKWFNFKETESATCTCMFNIHYFCRCVSQEENDKVLEENKVLMTRWVWLISKLHSCLYMYVAVNRVIISVACCRRCVQAVSMYSRTCCVTI